MSTAVSTMLSADCFTAMGNSVRKPPKIAYKHAHIRVHIELRRVIFQSVKCLKAFATMDSSSIEQFLRSFQFRTMDSSSFQAVFSVPRTAPFKYLMSSAINFAYRKLLEMWKTAYFKTRLVSGLS